MGRSKRYGSEDKTFLADSLSHYKWKRANPTFLGNPNHSYSAKLLKEGANDHQDG